MPEWLSSIISVTVSDSEQGNELVSMISLCCFCVFWCCWWERSSRGHLIYRDLWWVTTKNGQHYIREIRIIRAVPNRIVWIIWESKLTTRPIQSPNKLRSVHISTAMIVHLFTAYFTFWFNFLFFLNFIKDLIYNITLSNS